MFLIIFSADKVLFGPAFDDSWLHNKGMAFKGGGLGIVSEFCDCNCVRRFCGETVECA